MKKNIKRDEKGSRFTSLDPRLDVTLDVTREVTRDAARDAKRETTFDACLVIVLADFNWFPIADIFPAIFTFRHLRSVPLLLVRRKQISF